MTQPGVAHLPGNELKIDSPSVVSTALDAALRQQALILIG